MGSSKKHKEKDRERRHKHRHRSDRSRSRSGSRDRSHKREKKRRREVVDDDEYLYGREELENTYVPPSSSSRTKAEPTAEGRSSSAIGPASGDGSSLSIEETNKIRAKLGLKPLEIPSGDTGNGATKAEDEDVHVPAINLSELRQTQKLREKMDLQKEKRRISSKLSRVKTLGESDSDDDAKNWVKKSRKLEKEKAMAEKRAKMLEEMDEEFGISNLVEEAFKPKQKSYSSKDLQGLKVQHGLDTFKEGQTVILTLQDQGVLEDGEETLYNVNLKDDEFAKKNVENKKKSIDYKPYDEPQYDEYGMLKVENVLSKYDEEIEGKKAESFTLGSGGKYNAEQERAMERIRAQLRQQGQSLAMAAPTLATEFYSQEEMDAKFKKVKKKVRKIRKKEKGVKADDLLATDSSNPISDFGSRTRGRGMIKEEAVGENDNPEVYDHSVGYSSTAPETFDYNHGLPVKQEPMDVGGEEEEEGDILGPDEDLTGVAVEEDTAEQELHAALNKARKIKQAKREFAIPEKVAKTVKTEGPAAMDMGQNASMIVLNSTSEFCRSLGDIPTYGLSGNRDEERDELLDHELEMMERRKRLEDEEENTTGWSAVDVDTRPVNIDEEEKAVLDDEPVVNQGLGAALSLAMKKGYLEQEFKKKGTAPKHEHIQAQNYSIEDKRYEDLDEKYRKRDRFSGALVDFKEKDTYKPDVKLEYVDDSGRNLTPKEAFRQLSHRFHGKGSGKKKTEKRMKKLEEENLMKQMSSTDTPLGTLNLLKEKQRAEKSAYVLLTGSKGMAANTIVKTS
ncbi:U4/U6.U5 tri-snRNP-associated protein 1-like [Liolophura sinensis]|uniref:U4/U6.U5 tri-snRNP-associated protein 1-like n=1 Tax=Liolophura sinensis TaxID=3198878 RepID=UPI0031593437